MRGICAIPSQPTRVLLASWFAVTCAMGCAEDQGRPAGERATDSQLDAPDGGGDATVLQPRDVFECDALAQQAIESFYETHGDRWALSVTKTAADGALELMAACSSGTSELVLKYATSELNFSLRFNCGQLHGTSVEAFNQAAPVLTLDQLPTGLAIAGCPIDFNALPPASRVDDAVEVLALGDARIQLRVRTRLFSVQGWSRDEDACPYIADGPAPEQCYASVRQDIMLDATFDLPFDGATFGSAP